MKSATLEVKSDTDPTKVAVLEAKAKLVIRSGLAVLVKSQHESGTGTSISTRIVALTCELANAMGSLDREAAAEIFELLGGAIRHGEIPGDAERQRMIDAQKRLFLGDVALQARQECRGSA